MGESRPPPSQVRQTDAEVRAYLRGQVEGGFDEGRFGPLVGFANLRAYLEDELAIRYQVGRGTSLKSHLLRGLAARGGSARADRHGYTLKVLSRFTSQLLGHLGPASLNPKP